MTSEADKERIQKALARMGLGSRRAVESWIVAGRITINGKAAKLGDHVTLQDRIAVDGKAVYLKTPAPNVMKVIAYHKPENEVCTRNDPEGRPTVFEHLPSVHGGRWISVGRLDINTSGLLLLTTDGELAHRLMHPSRTVEREYAVRVFGRVDTPLLQRMLDGVQLEDGPARFVRIQDAGGEGINHWYHVVLTEGRQREVRRLWESQGCKVARLTRVRFGPITLPRTLRRGRWQALPPEEVAALYSIVGLTLATTEDVPIQRGRPRQKTPVVKRTAAPSSAHKTPAVKRTTHAAPSKPRGKSPTKAAAKAADRRRS